MTILVSHTAKVLEEPVDALRRGPLRGEELLQSSVLRPEDREVHLRGSHSLRGWGELLLLCRKRTDGVR